ncbi:MAG: IPExxxVDY family protein [Cyclobacteriaceae bacterium]
MKKNRLDLIYEFDFELAGIVCNKKEYKLAWHINSVLEISLAKKEDIKIEFSNRPTILISNCKYETEFIEIELLRNKLITSGSSKPQFLLPELKQFDYLLKLKDATGELSAANVCVNIREIPLVEYVSRLNFDELKSKENLLY